MSATAGSSAFSTPHAVGEHHVDLGAQARSRQFVGSRMSCRTRQRFRSGRSPRRRCSGRTQSFAEDGRGVRSRSPRPRRRGSSAGARRRPVLVRHRGPTAAIQEQALAAGQADVCGRRLQQPGHQARGLAGGAAAAVAPTTGMRPVFVLRGNRWSTIASPTGAASRPRLQVHQQRPGPGVDLDDGRLLAARASDMSSATRSMPAMSRPTMRAASEAIGGDRGGPRRCSRSPRCRCGLDQHASAGRRHRLGGEALALEFRHRHRSSSHVDAAQRKSSVDAAARIGVDLRR